MLQYDLNLNIEILPQPRRYDIPESQARLGGTLAVEGTSLKPQAIGTNYSVADCALSASPIYSGRGRSSGEEGFIRE